MGTPVEVVIDMFLKLIDDEILANMEASLAEDLLLTYLALGCADFYECKKNIKISGAYFVDELTSLEQEIIAMLMVPHWLSPKILREDNLKILITDSDYNQKSPASLLGQLNSMKKQIKYDLKVKRIEYTYLNTKEWF